MPDESDTYQAQPSGDNVPNVDPSTHQQDGFFDHVSTEHQRNQPVNGIDSSVDAEKLRDARTRNSPTRNDQRDTYITTDGREAAEDGAEIQELKHSSSESEKDYDAISPIEEVNLKRLASSMRSQSYIQGRRPSAAGTSAGPADTLERQATIAGLTLDDEVFDPKSPNFDFYKFIRMAMKILDEEGMTPKRAGIVFKDLNVRGNGDALNIQPDIGGWFTAPLRIGSLFRKKTPRHILRNFDGVVKSGELLIVLGRPGSGCSTLLKSMTGQLHGLSMDESSKIHYNGVEQGLVLKELKGEIIYNQEVDKHFPHLTVGETLEHAAALRMPKTLPSTGLSKQQAIEYITQIVMAVYGLSHTYNTKVGNDFVRGVSGGERKRVSIAEMALAGSALAAWDNSTRGLDSATALAFVKSLRLAANLNGSAHAVAIYQASQAIYDLFDKAVVLYEGREIFFGKANQAKKYFESMGWHCPPRQTTGDFLTSVTNPVERKALDGYEDKVPRTPDEFESYWRSSPEYADLQREISEYEEKYPVGGGSELQAFRDYKRANYAKHVRPKSPFAVGVPRQVSLNTKRAAQRIWNDPASTFTPIVINVIMALIIGSVFFDTPNATGSFTAKGAVLFFAVLLNALMSISEISNLYDQRPIVEKHKSYAFYHPYTEAFAGIVLDIPTKFMTAVAFNVVLYFLSGLRREPSQFFIFFLINYVTMFTMIAMFRTMAAITKTISQAMAISGVLILAIVVYTGFVVPVKYMHPWFSWIRYINPVYYAFEILIANEFHGRRFACSQFVPAYNGLSGDTFVCSQTGAVPGQLTVLGELILSAFAREQFQHL
jgi:ABC-type multidrug transport system ATPase subunit